MPRLQRSHTGGEGEGYVHGLGDLSGSPWHHASPVRKRRAGRACIGVCACACESDRRVEEDGLSLTPLGREVYVSSVISRTLLMTVPTSRRPS